jgi:hypothetical protein
MGFMEEVFSGGDTKLLKFDGRAGNYVARGSDETFNGQEFVADIYAAKGGYIRFGGKGQAPDRHLGLIFPKDEAPLRSSLGDIVKSEWPKGKFGDEPEDPWTQVIEIPLRHKESGELYLFTAQSRTSLSAAKDFLGHCRRLPENVNPLIRLGVGSYKGKFGTVKKPTITIIGRIAIETGEETDSFSDGIPF